MHIIYTHSNADFDAIASLLGAWHLYREAVPVLPPTLNRNVRDFVTLYESKLPFVRHNDLGREAITQLTLVDTQHVPRLKNIDSSVKLHIIDHHDLHQNLPADAKISLSNTGANVTVFVEKICERAIPLTSIEATLILLGIYEDTGSFTYSNTTARDLQAAAWLLSKGHAHLDIVREYLNYPMSDEQTALYDQLVDNLITLTLYGHTIVIGTARVNHYVEEISVLASRLRDLYQPDGLFILVEMSDHIQMVARSVTDAINVATIAEHFGGGGHPRASAALIKNGKLDNVTQKLDRLLHLEVKPALTVGQIMSKGARILAPTDTVQHAAGMMDRYGHEGFPVVDNMTRKIVGILSRREVDKALRHKLGGAAIEQFMTKGHFYATPADSVDTVQKLMTEEKIGQVPVINPDTGRIIGIVTRTDLINLWQFKENERGMHLNLGEPLEMALSPELFELGCEAGKIAAVQGDNLYIVGGFVRDLMLTMREDSPETKAKASPRFDLDLVVEGDAIVLAEALCQRHGGRVRSHQRFGTAKWIPTDPIPFVFDTAGQQVYLTSLDFVTARSEFYRHPSALPEVEQSSIRQDLHRRDFTINTLALRLSPHHFGELLDFYGGCNDLEARLIRVLHSLSFVEDPTRMLRAARIMARLEFALEERTAELLENALDLLDRVSGERVSRELDLIFRERYPEKAIQKLDELGILAAIHHGLMVDDLLLSALKKLRVGLGDSPWWDTTPDMVHYIGLMTFWLAKDELDHLMERLNLRTHQRTTLKQVYRIKRQISKIAAAKRNSQLCHALDGTSSDARLIAWLALDDETARKQLAHYEADLKDATPLIDGTALRDEFHLRPGPIFKTIIDALRDARVDGQVITLADEHALVEQILANNSAE
ncbi:MAG: CBS domain-containing protein [Anaerolineae bacterium]|nr:CBS domain-containing protein [Anaerolineae bacterium]